MNVNSVNKVGKLEISKGSMFIRGISNTKILIKRSLSLVVILTLASSLFLTGEALGLGGSDQDSTNNTDSRMSVRWNLLWENETVDWLRWDELKREIRGPREDADEFANDLLEFFEQEGNQGWADDFLDWWYDQIIDKNKIFQMFIKSPVLMHGSVNKLIEEGKGEKANELANKTLEYWLEKDNEVLEYYWEDLLDLTIRINSEYYYSEISEKKWNSEEVRNENAKEENLEELYPQEGKKDFAQDSDYFSEELPVLQQERYLDLANFLVEKTYVVPAYLKESGIDLETLRKILEVRIYELIQDGDDRIFAILHAIALRAKIDPYFRLTLFAEEEELLGVYYPLKKRAELMTALDNDVLFKEVLIHEWGHQLMDVLFNNDSLPYRFYETDKINDYASVVQEIESSLDNIGYDLYYLWLTDPTFVEGIKLLKDVRKYYDNQDDYNAEYIVRFLEILVGGSYENPKNKELYEPLRKFWDDNIAPEIDIYIKEHAGVDDFVSSRLRKDILHPGWSNIEAEEEEGFIEEIQNFFKGWFDE